MTPTTTVNVTLTNVTPAQFKAITKLLGTDTDTEVTSHHDMAQMKKNATKKTKPAKTVSDDEDEEFGTKAMKSKDLEEDEDEDESEMSAGEDEESEEEETEDEEESEEPSISFQEVKAALNKYGEKHPDQARAILSGFNIKSPKELSATRNEKYWEPIYRKVMAKLKAAKKRK